MLFNDFIKNWNFHNSMDRREQHQEREHTGASTKGSREENREEAVALAITRATEIAVRKALELMNASTSGNNSANHRTVINLTEEDNATIKTERTYTSFQSSNNTPTTHVPKQPTPNKPKVPAPPKQHKHIRV